MMKNLVQSALDPAGIQALHIENLWWLMFWVSVAVWIIVVLFLIVAARRANQPAPATLPIIPGSDRPLLRSVAAATAVTVLVLFGLLVASVVTGRAMSAQRDETVLLIRVTGYQWWWDVEYQHPDPSERVRTANELHIPAGRTVGIKLLGADVIHSFWAPTLHGKMDAIPGHESYLWIRSDKPGIYRGQCAEFCGVQHAHMAFTVQVEPSDDFERWIQLQRLTATPPSSQDAKRGLDVIEQRSCSLCHQILGTQAGGRAAPDLTHLASRPTIAAGTLPMTRDNLTAWIQDPQRFKPGTRMPKIDLTPEELKAVVSYLENLK
jgi:cytochrome c oxidase subunit II